MAKAGDKKRIEENAQHLNTLRLLIAGANVRRADLQCCRCPLERAQRAHLPP